MLTFPFEALSMNYEPHGVMSSQLDDIYERLIEKRHGGGYCLQINLLYREVLAKLAFRFVGVLGRVFSPISNSWTGLTHTATLVYLPSHIASDRGSMVYYLSDVGFGSSPHRPMLLRNEWQEFGRGGDKFRMVHRHVHPQSTFEPAGDEQVDQHVAQIARDQSVWILQHHRHGTPDWLDCYSFSTAECFYPDYHASNKATSHPESQPFATMILVVRYLLHAPLVELSEELLERDKLPKQLYPYHPSVVEQRMIVGDKHIIKVGDQQVLSEKIADEGHRVDLLKHNFALLTHVEKDDALREIRGKPSSLNALSTRSTR